MSSNWKAIFNIKPRPLLLVVFIGILAAVAAYIGARGGANFEADCYYDSDCSPDRVCARFLPYWTTTHTNRDPDKIGSLNDGVCFDARIKANPFLHPSAEFPAVGIWFDAYREVGLNGTGRLTMERVKQLEAQASSLPHPNLSSKQVRNAVHSALQVTMGYDLRFDPGEPWLVAIPKLHPQALELIDATKEGFEAAIKANDPDKIVIPIERFWQKNPDFHPMHTGPCYVHGHKWIQTVTDQKNCQVNGLKRILSVLLGVGKPQG